MASESFAREMSMVQEAKKDLGPGSPTLLRGWRCESLCQCLLRVMKNMG